MNLSARLDKLERTGGNGRVIVIWQNHDESDDAAIARWCAARPGEPKPDPNSSDVYLIQ